ncbi:hypothetical protein Anapl_11589 [Anas platyrhynchos]|uniref:Uncharacterized protein n=1 Tax=Anas platyrhynchos TaxID=8839 RepID=R0K694_ANAPL|nr:hypothetical protein Anapl_11589 [Anas platyrhynchos]
MHQPVQQHHRPGQGARHATCRQLLQSTLTTVEEHKKQKSDEAALAERKSGMHIRTRTHLASEWLASELPAERCSQVLGVRGPLVIPPLFLVTAQARRCRVQTVRFQTESCLQCVQHPSELLCNSSRPLHTKLSFAKTISRTDCWEDQKQSVQHVAGNSSSLFVYLLIKKEVGRNHSVRLLTQFRQQHQSHTFPPPLLIYDGFSSVTPCLPVSESCEEPSALKWVLKRREGTGRYVFPVIACKGRGLLSQTSEALRWGRPSESPDVVKALTSKFQMSSEAEHQQEDPPSLF